MWRENKFFSPLLSPLFFESSNCTSGLESGFATRFEQGNFFLSILLHFCFEDVIIIFFSLCLWLDLMYILRTPQISLHC